MPSSLRNYTNIKHNTVKLAMASGEIQIHPTGWETSPESERHPLSLIGHIMPKIYVLIAEVFELPSDVDTVAVTQNMQAGLEFALSQFPVLTGALEMDSDTGQMFLVRKRSSTLSLHIKHFPGEGVFPSYQELAQKDVRVPNLWYIISCSLPLTWNSFLPV